MPTYGPWVTPPIQTAFVRNGSLDPSDDPLANLDVPLSLSLGQHPSTVELGEVSSSGVTADRLVAPAYPFPDPGPSKAAWSLALEEKMAITPLGSDGGPAPAARVWHLGAHGLNTATINPDDYLQHDFWEVQFLRYRLNGSDAGALSFSNWGYEPPTPPSGVRFELEPGTRPTITGAAVGSMVNPAYGQYGLTPGDLGGKWTLFMKPQGETEWTYFSTPDLSYNDVLNLGSEVMDGYVLTPAEVESLQRVVVGSPDARSPEMVEFLFAWTGGYPWDHYFTGGTTPPIVGEWEAALAPALDFRISYQPRRFRYVYPDELPSTSYRRNYPRHDSLAGGAGRNYPPSRAVQTSNRTSGGYI